MRRMLLVKVTLSSLLSILLISGMTCTPSRLRNSRGNSAQVWIRYGLVTPQMLWSFYTGVRVHLCPARLSIQPLKFLILAYSQVLFLRVCLESYGLIQVHLYVLELPHLLG